jgi:pSer/pThr/pTyr-binding forkhead associated (FHA) protein
MNTGNLPREPLPSATTGFGELVLQNGRQAGARRPLGMPATVVGRTEGCDVRLNVDGVDPLHCLLVFFNGGVQLRDLNSLHGTYVNGSRVQNVTLQQGDLLKVGPFQFRVELSIAVPEPLAQLENSIEEDRSAMRIQIAAVAAQQIALEEEEAHLQQRSSELQKQEEQLAAHLAEKQRQVQLWSEYTKAERENLRKEKIEQEKRMDALEQEMLQAKQDVNNDHQKLTQERQRVNKVYQRLRQRWQHQWAAEKEKHLKEGKRLLAEAIVLQERDQALSVREAALTQETLRFNTERELGVRQLHEGRDALTKAQEIWRRRRSQEFTVLKEMHRKAEDTQAKVEQARRLLVDEKGAWDKQLHSLQKELHGINNRIVHQRYRVQEQGAELARLDAILRERQLLVGSLPKVATEVVPGDEKNLPECEVVVVADDGPPTVVAPAPHEDLQRRLDGLDQLASELADQRCHLLEQYQLLAEIQTAWQGQRDQASADLEMLAQRLLLQEQALAQRDQQAAADEELLRQRQHDLEIVRQEIHVWRAQLKTRETTFEQEHQVQMATLVQKEALLQEQLTTLTQLRQRWNQRRQQELDQLRANRIMLDEQQAETHQRRATMFEKGQQIDEEKRILAEKSLALEQYRQEVFFRAKDPTAQRRVERLRRRWLTLNSALIRNAKAEREAAKKELAQLEAQRTELLATRSQFAEDQTAIAEKETSLEEREVILRSRQAHLEEELIKLESRREHSQQQQLRMQDQIDTLAKAVYDDEDMPAIDQAA